MIVLDTTVLAYAVGEEHPLRDPCRRLLRAHAEGRLEATTTVETIQEFAHIRARDEPGQTPRWCAHYLAAFTLLMTTPDDLEHGLDLFDRHPALAAFDAILAAVALRHGADALVSADHAFASVPGLPWVDPATDSIATLIA